MTLIEELSAVIRRHIPGTKRSCQGYSDVAETHARLIRLEASYGPLIFGQTPGAENLSDALKLGRAFSMRLSDFQPELKKVIDQNARARGTAQLDELVEAVRDFNSITLRLLRTDTFTKKARKNKNWKAMSIARRCVRIWAIEARFTETGSDDEMSDEDLKHWGQRFVKRDSKSSFGLFLEDVLSVLEVTNAEGEVVSASTAMRALTTIEG